MTFTAVMTFELRIGFVVTPTDFHDDENSLHVSASSTFRPFDVEVITRSVMMCKKDSRICDLEEKS